MKLKDLKAKIEKKLTKRNLIIGAIVIFAGGAVYNLGGKQFLINIFSSRAGQSAIEEEAGKDLEKFKKPSQCSRFYPWGAPAVKDKEVNDRSLFMCRNAYSIQYDPKLKVPLWSIEDLKKVNLAPFNLPSNYGPMLDPDLPNKMQATLTDYQTPGYTFGFLVPFQDVYINDKNLHVDELEKLNEASLHESFFLSNAAPQSISLHSLWQQSELLARTLAIQKEEVFVISGPIYLTGKTNGSLGSSKIPVPTHFFKVITDPKSYGSVSYIFPNENLPCGNQCSLDNFIVPIQEVERVSGMELYPKLAPYYAVQVKKDVNQIFKNNKPQ